MASITEMDAELQAAIAAHQEAARSAAEASRRETAALNRLNAAQRAISTWLTERKKQALYSTDWGHEARR